MNAPSQVLNMAYVGLNGGNCLYYHLFGELIKSYSSTLGDDVDKIIFINAGRFWIDSSSPKPPGKILFPVNNYQRRAVLD